MPSDDALALYRGQHVQDQMIVFNNTRQKGEDQHDAAKKKREAAIEKDQSIEERRSNNWVEVDEAT